ncbi:MAG: response regulator [Chromatiales bacterium]|jgi:diguanylate cyclase (GGDEF)-like protein
MDENHIELDKPRILVVDDSRTMRKAMRRLLCQDFDVIEAEDGEGAWRVLSEDSEIKVVFSDLVMPRMNGFELLRNIRESIHTRISQLPVVIITGHNDDERMHRQAMSLGATDFITKPFDSIQLKARAKACVKYEDTSRKLEHASWIIETQSTIDPLTGLANKLYFREHGPELISFALRHDKPLAVLRLNVDKYDVLFKKKGKQVAEKILVHISKIISGSVRSEDTVARVGLAQFAVLMPGADEKTARKIAQRVHDLMLKTGYRIGNARFRMTMSAGLVCPALSADLHFDEVLKVAESRLHKAVASGGNKLIFEEDSLRGTRAAKGASGAKHLLTVEEALVLLKAGEHGRVSEQIRLLVERVYPLLAFGNKRLRLGLDGSLLQLRDRLDRLKEDVAA